MANISIEDIQEFLHKQNIEWNGEIIEGEEPEWTGFIPVNVDFPEEPSHKIFLRFDEIVFQIWKEKWYVCYEETSYSKSLVEDLSQDWIKFLLVKHPELADYYIDTANTNINEIKDKAEKKLNSWQRKIDSLVEDTNDQLLPWVELEELAKSLKDSKPTTSDTRNL